MECFNQGINRGLGSCGFVTRCEPQTRGEQHVADSCSELGPKDPTQIWLSNIIKYQISNIIQNMVGS